VIQPTEALTVIDVNTGKCVSKKNDDLAKLKLNLEAAVEVARQIRLRNLSGIILVDFINLESSEMMESLLESLNKELKKDSIATTLVDVTKLQLVEITRKKVRKPLHETIHE
jgi:ribonuclease G